MEGSTGRGARGSIGLTGWLEAEGFAAASLRLEVRRLLKEGRWGVTQWWLQRRDRKLLPAKGLELRQGRLEVRRL